MKCDKCGDAIAGEAQIVRIGKERLLQLCYGCADEVAGLLVVWIGAAGVTRLTERPLRPPRSKRR